MNCVGKYVDSSDTEHNVKLSDKQRRMSEASLRYYYKNKEKITERRRERYKTDEAFKAKIIESERQRKEKLKDNEEFKERAKQYSKMYYQQTRAQLLLFRKFQHDLESSWFY